MRHGSFRHRGLQELGSMFRGETFMGRLLLSIALVAGLSDVAFGQTSLTSEIAPGGKLRVGMIAITVLGGVAEPVAGFVAQKLGATLEPVMYPNPDTYLQSFGKGEWDIAIGPRVLAPADKADSTADIWAVNLVYVAAPGTEFSDIASVDRAGVRIGTIRGAPSDRVLTREIKAAEIVRIQPQICRVPACAGRSPKPPRPGAAPGRHALRTLGMWLDKEGTCFASSLMRERYPPSPPISLGVAPASRL